MKFFKFLFGLILTLLYTRIFSFRYLAGKRIVLVGPASSAFNTDKGGYIDSFDVVIRVNKSAYVVHEGKFQNDIGTRTDILLHSFFENTESGGGPLNIDMYKKQGVKFLINPRSNASGLRNTLNFYKKYLTTYITYTLPSGFYRKICAPLKGYKPTVGLTALFLAMEADFKELYITGFTFYRTPFGAGYRDQIQDPDKAKAFILAQGIHNIDLEFEAFQKLLDKNKSKPIKMDDTLRDILLN